MDTPPKTPKSLYDASVGEIAYKNFLVGFMRGLGGFFITVLTWIFIYYFSITYLLPQLTGVLTEAKSMIQSIERIQNGATNLMRPSQTTSTQPTSSGSATQSPNGGIVIPPELIQQFQKLQQKQ